MKTIVLLSVATFTLLTLESCYYDRESDLYPITYCDTASVKWSTAVQPIIQQQCAYVGCHAAPTPGGGIDLTTYTGVKNIAQNGSLTGSIEHQSNYTPMPRSSEKLPVCMISKIKIWVAEGALEN